VVGVLWFRHLQVPVMWSKVGYPCLKPLASWFQDFKARISFFNEWLQNVEMKCYWVPGFFFPQVSQPLSFLALSELCRLLLSGHPVGHTISRRPLALWAGSLALTGSLDGAGVVGMQPRAWKLGVYVDRTVMTDARLGWNGTLRLLLLWLAGLPHWRAADVCAQVRHPHRHAQLWLRGAARVDGGRGGDGRGRRCADQRSLHGRSTMERSEGECVLRFY
jgi:hypothetical protein